MNNISHINRWVMNGSIPHILAIKLPSETIEQTQQKGISYLIYFDKIYDSKNICFMENILK